VEGRIARRAHAAAPSSRKEGRGNGVLLRAPFSSARGEEGEGYRSSFFGPYLREEERRLAQHARASLLYTEEERRLATREHHIPARRGREKPSARKRGSALSPATVGLEREELDRVSQRAQGKERGKGEGRGGESVRNLLFFSNEVGGKRKKKRASRRSCSPACLEREKKKGGVRGISLATTSISCCILSATGGEKERKKERFATHVRSASTRLSGGKR